MRITLNDIPAQHRDIAKFMVVNNFIDFCKQFGGINLYFPTKKTLFNSIRNKEIIQLYEQGKDIKYLSRKYNLTNSSIRQIIKK